jgi:hypothetical protein
MKFKKYGDFSQLLGQTLVSAVHVDEEIIFKTDTGLIFKMYHRQDCCESVYIHDIVGDLDDLIGSPILTAECVEDGDTPPVDVEYKPESYSWTFYKLSTIKGSVTISWYGESNGYYSETADFDEYEE